MQLGYGNFLHPLNEAAVAITRDSLLNEAGLLYGFRETWAVQGFLQQSTQDAVTAQCTLMEAAYARDYLTLTLFANDGSIARRLPGRTAIGGTRVLSLSYPDDGLNTAEWSTYRHYQLRLECTYPAPGAGTLTLLSFQETLSFTGGGPRFVHLQPLVGLPQRQQVAEATPFKVTQRGRAVGLLAYPVPPPPIWPAAEHIDQRVIDPESPKRSGDAAGSVYTEWPVSWSYFFEANVPLQGQPTLWRG